MKKKYINLTIVSSIIGFMLYVQYNTVQNPTERDTKDIWDIRNELSEEQKRHSSLLTSIKDVNEKIRQYEDGSEQNPEQILQQTITELQQQAGNLPVTGPGFTIHIKPSFDVIQFGYEVEAIPTMLLTRLINELNRNGAKQIELGNERLTFWTAIRDINGNTTVNGRILSKSNVDIKIVTNSYDQAKKLYNYILASSLMDEFFIDNLLLEVSEVETDLTISSTVQLVEQAYLKGNE